MAIGLRNYQKRILMIRSAILLAFLVAVALSLSVYTRFTIERDMSARAEAAMVEEQRLRDREAIVRHEVERLQNNSGQEAEMRERFDIAKDGEKVVILVDDDEASATATSTPSPSTRTPAPWYLFWQN